MLLREILVLAGVGAWLLSGERKVEPSRDKTSGLYFEGAHKILQCQLNVVGNAIYAQLLDTSYNFNPEHNRGHFSGHFVGNRVKLRGRRLLGMTTFMANDVTFRSISGRTIGGIALIDQNGSPLAYVAVDDIVPNGGDITVAWDRKGIFTL